MAVDDTLFKRWGSKVLAALWTHDGSAQGGKTTARGNRWMVAGIVVDLPFLTTPLCLPVMFRLWAGKHHRPGQVGRRDAERAVPPFPDRAVHGVGDAAYHGKPLLVGNDVDHPAARNAALYG